MYACKLVFEYFIVHNTTVMKCHNRYQSPSRKTEIYNFDAE